MAIRFNNYAKKVGRRGEYNWFKWRLFVDEDDDVLDTIDSVRYVPHPTFPNPSRTTKQQETKFAVNSSGWGSFSVFIDVRFKDGTEYETRYYLDLSKPWPD